MDEPWKQNAGSPPNPDAFCEMWVWMGGEFVKMENYAGKMQWHLNHSHPISYWREINAPTNDLSILAKELD